VLFLLIVTPLILMIAGLIMWTAITREPNRGLERDGGMFPWPVKNGIARSPSWPYVLRRLDKAPSETLGVRLATTIPIRTDPPPNSAIPQRARPLGTRPRLP
jgi:hypothetical protein